MKLVIDNENVSHLPIRNLADIAGMARGFADDIDQGRWGTVDRVICLVENEDGIRILGWGENTSAYELMGMFEAAKLKVFAEDMIPGDEE
jgi:hypothetical protein